MMREKLSRIVTHPSFVPVTTSLVSVGIGMGIGYILGRRSSKNIHVIPAQEPLDYEELEAFIAEAKEEAGIKGDSLEEEIVVPAPPPVSDTDRIAYGAEMVAKTLKREMTSTHKQEPDIVATTEFAHDEGWDYDTEVAKRNSNHPYVIHYDEYFANEMEDAGYLQMALTYYAEDDILADQNDTPVYNHTDIVGNLEDQAPGVPNVIFGHGSKGDPNTVYIRNDKRKAEYEINRDSGGFAQAVMGLDLENGGERAKRLAHSRVDKFRPDD